MNRRGNKILNELIWNEKLNILEFKEKYNVQERSIRLDIKGINDDLQKAGLPVISENSEGELELENKRQINIKEFEKFITNYDFYSYTMTKNERHTVLALILLNGREYITVDKLKKEIGVSRNTILSDLQELKIWFEDRDMNLKAKAHVGYTIEASESQIRENILKLLEINSEEYYQNGYMLNIYWNLLLKQVDYAQSFDYLKSILLEEEEDTGVILEDYSFYEAIVELVIMVNRMSREKYLTSFEESGREEIEISSKYPFSKSVLNKIAVKYDIRITEEEILMFTKCLRRKRYLKGERNSANSLDIKVMIAEAIHSISGKLGIDFYLDFGLYDLMVAHMKSAVYRVMNGEVLVNPFKEAIINDYPEILKIVHKELEKLEGFIGKKFSEDEVLFLVLYFASVIEKEKVENNKNKKIPVALVCATGRGTVQFMLAKLKILDDIIEIVSVSSHHNMKEIEQSGAKMIISTIPLPDAVLPSVVIRSPMLDDKDILNIQQKVFELKGQNKEEMELPNIKDINENTGKDIQGAFYQLLSTDRIVLDYPAKDWEEAIKCAGQLLRDSGAVTGQYIDEMVNNVKKHGAYIVVCKGMALPHADSSKGVIKEAASFVRLKKGIEFGSEFNDPVRYVIGMSIKDAESINQAIYDMMMIFGDENNIRKFDELPNEQSVLDMIKSFEKK